MLKYLVDWEKSSTFASDFALNASERLNDANDTEKRNAENQPLTKKVQKYWKKVAENLEKFKKNLYFNYEIKNLIN